MKAFLLLFISSLLSAQTLWLGSPNVGGRMIIVDGPGTTTAWANEASVNFTVDSVLVSVGGHIWCSGVVGNPNANGHHLVRSIDGNKLTLENVNHSDLPAYAGTKVDLDTYLPGNQWGYCHALGEFNLNPSPRLFPKAGSTLYNNLFGTGGPGSATGTLSRASTAYQALLTRAGTASTSSPGICDGNTAAACSKEEILLNGSGVMDTRSGDAALFTAMAWALTGELRYRNSSIYLMKNVNRIIGTNPTFSASDFGTAGSGRGEDGEYSSWLPLLWAYAYDILADVNIPGMWEAADKERLRKKLFENKTADGCVNPLRPFTGEITLEYGKNIGKVTNSSGFTVGQWVYAKTRQNRFKRDDGTLTNIVVNGNIAVATYVGKVSNVVNGTPVRVTGSGLPELDKVWFTTLATACGSTGLNCPTTITFSVTGVAPGTYSAAGMELFAYYNAASASGQMFRVTGIPSATEITLHENSGWFGVNSPLALVDTTYSDGMCSISEVAASHGYSPGYSDRALRLTLSPVPDATTTTFKTSVAAAQSFRNIQLPIVYQYFNEMGDVTAVDFNTGDLTVVRGKYNTAAYNHVGAPGESGAFSVRRHGWDASSYSFIGQVQTGTVHNLLTSKNAPQITELLAFAHVSSIARADLEMMWNYMYDTDFQELKKIMTGISPGGATSGYSGGRFGFMIGKLASAFVAGLNPPIDFTTGKEWLNQFGCFMPYASIPWANVFEKPYHVSFADSGDEFAWENDDWSILAVNNHFNAGSTCQMIGYDFVTENGVEFFTRSLTSILGSENIIDQLVYTLPSTPKQNYKTSPLSYFFDKTDFPSSPSKKYKGLSSRTNWTEPTASLWWVNYLDSSTDHAGTYNLEGSYQLHKNTALLLPGLKAGLSGNDARYQNGLRFIRPYVTGLGAADNELVMYSLKLVDAAPAGGAKVDFTTDSDFVVPPASIVVPEGLREISIPLLAYQTTPSSLAHLTAISENTVDYYIRNGNLAGPLTPTNTQALTSLSCYLHTAPLTSTGTITAATGGTPIRCTVTLTAAGTNGTTVNLSTNLAGATVPASIRVRNGKTKGSFFVSLQPTTSGSLIVTASSAGSVQSPAIVVTPIATPGTAALAAVIGGSDANGALDNATGGLIPGAFSSITDRVKQTESLAYVFADTTPAYSPTAGNVNQASRTFLHSKRASGRDIAVVYDRIDLGNNSAHTGTGGQPVFLDSFYRGSTGPNEVVNNSPATTQTKLGNVFTFRKPMQTGAVYGGDAMLTLVMPFATGRTSGDFLAPAAGKFSADVVTYGNPTGETEVLKVFMPAANVTDTPPTITALGSTSTGYRGIRTGESSPRVIVLRTGPATVAAMNYMASSYSGTADHIIDGLEAGTYNVTRDGSSLLTDVVVASDGVLMFSATSTGAGLFQVTQAGATVPLDITDSSPLPNGSQGVAYSKTFAATGGTSPYSWSIVTGTLPSGVTLSTAGLLSGSPSATGTFNFRVRVTDTTSATFEKDFSLFISSSVPPLQITTTTLPNGTLSQPYSQPVNVTGGLTPYTCSISAGTLPAGLSITTPGGTGCLISGTPSAIGSASFTVRVVDAQSTQRTQPLTLQIDASVTPVVLTTSSLSACAVGVYCTQQLQASGGVLPYAYSVVSGTLPPGLTLSGSGTLSGTPTGGASSQAITFRVRDSRSGTPQTNDKTLTLTVNSGSLILSPVTGRITDGVLGSPYSFSFSREGGSPPFVWTMSGAPGLSIADGQITGTPTATGDFDVVVQVTDDNGESVTANVVLPVRTSSTSIGLHVVAAGTSAIARLRAVGVDYSVVCSLMIVDSEDRIVTSTTVGPGSSNRLAVLSGLTPGADYNAQASCAGRGGSYAFRSEIVSGTAGLDIALPAYPDVSNVLIEYGTTSELGTAQSAPCVSGCTIRIEGLTRGQVYFLRRKYRDPGNNIVKQSSMTPVLIQ